MVEEALALRSPCQRSYYDNQDMDTVYQPTLALEQGAYTTPQYGTVHPPHMQMQSEEVWIDRWAHGEIR